MGLYCSGSMCVSVTLWFGWGGVVSVCRLKHFSEHAGEREGYSKDYTLYQRLTVQKNDLLMMSFAKARNM